MSKVTDEQIINLLDQDSWVLSTYQGQAVEYVFDTTIALSGVKAMLAHAFREGLQAGEGVKRANPYE